MRSSRIWLLAQFLGYREQGKSQGSVRQILKYSSTTQKQPVTWTDSRGYEHFKKRGPWYHNRRIWYGLGGALVVGGVVYVNSLQVIPYTLRSHSVLVSVSSEQQMGQQMFRQTKSQAEMTRTLLPEHHPYTRKVNQIGGGKLQEHYVEDEFGLMFVM
eukprot:TRINITY_DN10847_c0_g1_i8.p2 TRINITY_DN10847_c0_g1~~TRINITY_DN10847_c0_g1_i8.p2  ORF type:complete len:157 (+),score=2.13 TRINITY_DN10847_c0_g1_i8:77-547(+)